MKGLNFLKKVTVFDIIIVILFIVINVLSIILFGLIGLISLPILTILILIYFNTNKLAILFKNIKKKRKKGNKKITKKEKYNLEDEFEEDEDIILKDKKVDVENVYEKKKVNNMKKVSKNKKVSKKKIKEKKKKINILKVILSTFLIFCIIGVLGVASFLAYIVMTTEDFDPNKLTYQDQTKVYDKNGIVFATLGTEKRESVTYEKLPQVLIDAIIATEDSRFFQHNGVDFPRFLKASVGQLLGQSSAGGASTLTMQV